MERRVCGKRRDHGSGLFVVTNGLTYACKHHLGRAAARHTAMERRGRLEDSPRRWKMAQRKQGEGFVGVGVGMQCKRKAKKSGKHLSENAINTQIIPHPPSPTQRSSLIHHHQDRDHPSSTIINTQIILHPPSPRHRDHPSSTIINTEIILHPSSSTQIILHPPSPTQRSSLIHHHQHRDHPSSTITKRGRE